MNRNRKRQWMRACAVTASTAFLMLPGGAGAISVQAATETGNQIETQIQESGETTSAARQETTTKETITKETTTKESITKESTTKETQKESEIQTSQPQTKPASNKDEVKANAGTTHKAVNVKPAVVNKVSRVKATPASVTIKWGAVKNAKGYVVYVYDQKGKLIKKITTQKTQTTISKLKEGQQIKCKVQAYRIYNGRRYNSDFPKQLTKLAAAYKMPAVPAKVKITKKTTSVVAFSWNKSKDAKSYKIVVNDSKGKLVKEVSVGNHLKGEVTGLKNNTKYSFRIEAIRGTSVAKTKWTGVKTEAARPAVVKDITAKVQNENKLCISWKAAKYAQSYEILIKKDGKQIKKVSTKDIKATISGLEYQTTYTYSVKAVNGDKNSCSEPKEFTTESEKRPMSGANQTWMGDADVMVANCGGDENGNARGGNAGDQSGQEWVVQPWFNDNWGFVIRHPNKKVSDMMAKLATEAANNDHIGYDQGERLTFWQQLVKANYLPQNIKTDCEADCSAGVAAIVKATGYRLNLSALKNVSEYAYTGSLKQELKKAGFEILTGPEYTQTTENLQPGDVLLHEYVHTTIVANCKGNAGKQTHAATNKNYAYDSSASQTTSTKLIQTKQYVKEPKDISLRGTYVTTDALNLRVGAGTQYAVELLMQQGAKVECYGYYNIWQNVKWYYLAVDYKGKSYVGFASSKYLKKVK